MALNTEERAVVLPSAAPKSVTILGSTGSVGCQTIDLLERDRGNFKVVALTANQNVELLVKQAIDLRPDYVAIGDERQYDALKQALSGTGIEVGAGEKGI